MTDFQHLIRDIANFPAPGIVFKDITPLLGDREGFAAAIRAMAEPWRDQAIDQVVGVESRGFIIGAALARELDTGFVPIRKPGKLPATTIAQDYALEYGKDRIEIHADAVSPGQRVLLVDDVFATGGTLLAARTLLGRLGAEVVAAAVLIEITALAGRQRWPESLPLQTVLSY